MITESRFWSKVNTNDECWLWTGATNGRYGQLRVTESYKKSRCIPAHRISYELSKGKIPDGSVVMHICDNPLCVRPEHLILGSQSDNLNDMVRRGRDPKPNRRLTDDQVREIRKRLSSEKHADIAQDYNICRTVVTRIASGSRWSSVK